MMHKDVVSIIAKLIKRYWMQKINKQYREDYNYKYNSITKNIKECFIFNYRNPADEGKFIYNLFKEDCLPVCRLPKNYF